MFMQLTVLMFRNTRMDIKMSRILGNFRALVISERSDLF